MQCTARFFVQVLPGSLVAALALGVSGPSAQQYADQRVIVPLGNPGTSAPGDLRSGDIDGDGRADLIVRLDFNVDWVFRGQSGAEPFAYTDLVDGADSNDGRLADLDGDGRADYLTQQFFLLGWYGGQANGTLGAFQSIQGEGAGEVFWDKAIGDVDGDGNPDVLVSMSTNSTGSGGVVRWFSGAGSGSFGGPQEVTVADYARDLALGDFNMDGELDVAGTGVLQTEAYVLYGQGGALTAEAPVLPGGAPATLVESGDLDADGIDDLACVTSMGELDWYRGGPAGLAPAGSVSISSSFQSPRDLFAADLDDDGADDLLAALPGTDGNLFRMMGASGVGPTVAMQEDVVFSEAVLAVEFDDRPGLDLLYLPANWAFPGMRSGDGSGGFLGQFFATLSGLCATQKDAFCVGDVNGDGALDIASKLGGWLEGDGSGGFLPEASLGARPSELIDLDGDGVLDAIGNVPACSPPGGLQVSRGLGGGAFAAATFPSQPAGLEDFDVADVDADGDLDLVSATELFTYTHLNDGTGTFAPELQTALTGGTRLAAGDLNGDGLADVARLSYFGTFSGTEAVLAWGLSLGGGVIGSVQEQLLFQSNSDEIVMEDVNHDGDLDVLFARNFGGQAVVAHGDGQGGLAPNEVAATFSGTGSSLAFADIDGDGMRDILLGSLTFPLLGPWMFVGVARWNGSEYEVSGQIGAPTGAGKIVPADFDADGRVDLAFGFGQWIRVALSQQAEAPGISSLGDGTPGCLGRASLGTVTPPTVGNADFRVLAQNLPPGGFGWFGLGNATDAAGSDPLGLGVLMHLDPIASSFVEVFLASADSGGQASLALPVPPTAALAGAQVALQALHFGTLGFDCSASPLGLVSSRALEVVIQP